MSQCHPRPCQHCQGLFCPHPRNHHHQRFCSKAGCRQASKAQSQRRWLSKPDNQDYFRGGSNVQRVQQWRAQNPGYWKRPPKAPGTLQEVLMAQLPESQPLAPKTSLPPLQDVLATQDPLLLGLISHLIDSPLQEIIEQTTLQLLRQGHSILDLRSGRKPKENYENQKAHPLSTTAPAHSRTVQLDRPTGGP